MINHDLQLAKMTNKLDEIIRKGSKKHLQKAIDTYHHQIEHLVSKDDQSDHNIQEFLEAVVSTLADCHLYID